MEAFNHVSDMYDVALKTRLLHTLIKDHLPDEKHPSLNPSELSRVVSVIRTHHLLTEAFIDDIDQKQIGRWKSAVDTWVDCILTLTSSDMPDKCRSGISLLGFTCQECSSSRFLDSYPEWFENLLQVLQSPASSHFVRVASVASISDLFSRLSGFPNAKKNGSSFAAKVVQPVLRLLNDDILEVIWELVNNAFVDLSNIRNKVPGSSSLSNSNSSSKASLQLKSRKKKHKSKTGSLQHQEHDEDRISAADAPRNYPATPISEDSCA